MNEEEEDEPQRKWEDGKKRKSDGFSDVEWEDEEEDENPKKRKSDGFSDVEWEDEEEDENPKKRKSDGFSDVELEDEKEEPKLIFVIDTHGGILQDKIIEPELYKNITILKKNIACCGELCYRRRNRNFEHILNELKVRSFHTCAPTKEHEIKLQTIDGNPTLVPVPSTNPDTIQSPHAFSRSNAFGNKYDPCKIHEIKKGCNKVYNKKFEIDGFFTGIYITYENRTFNLFIHEDLYDFLDISIKNPSVTPDFLNTRVINHFGSSKPSILSFLLTSDLIEICNLINLHNNEIKVFGIIDSSCMILDMIGHPKEMLDNDFGTDHFHRAKEILEEGAIYGGIKKRNKSKRNKSKRNKTKRNKTKRNKTKRNKSNRNKTKRNKTKRNKTKRNNINKNSSS